MFYTKKVTRLPDLTVVTYVEHSIFRDTYLILSRIVNFAPFSRSSPNDTA
jgi:hypothetical protein